MAMMVCQDTDADVKDSYGQGCATYGTGRSMCESYDDGDFNSTALCCVCGGGEDVPVPRDWMALVVIGSLWVAFVASLCFDMIGVRGRPDRYSTTDSGVTVRRTAIEKGAKFKTQFIFRPTVADVAGKGSSMTDDIADDTEYYRDRSLEGFVQGVMVPPKPSVTYQTQYRTTTRWFVYRSLGKGALVRCARFVTICGLVASSVSWWMRACEGVSRRVGTNFFGYDAVADNLRMAAEVQSILLPLASFILALYINMKLGLFNSIISQTWGVQGKLNDIALILGCALRPVDDPAIVAIKFVLYRYLNVAHFFLYHQVATDYMSLTTCDLEMSGLLTREERTLLDRIGVAPRNTILLWIGTLLENLAAEGLLRPEFLQDTMELVQGLRGLSDTLVKELSRVPPISFAQMMQLMVDVLMLLTPLGLAFKFQTTRESSTVYVWPAVGSMVLALFYQGGLRIIAVMEYPFGTGIDALHLDWILMSSDKAIYGYLNSKAPKNLGRYHPVEARAEALKATPQPAPKAKPMTPQSKLFASMGEEGRTSAGTTLDVVLPGKPSK